MCIDDHIIKREVLFVASNSKKQKILRWFVAWAHCTPIAKQVKHLTMTKFKKKSFFYLLSYWSTIMIFYTTAIYSVNGKLVRQQIFFPFSMRKLYLQNFFSWKSTLIDTQKLINHIDNFLIRWYHIFIEKNANYGALFLEPENF